jgi:hypothetical protein
MIRPVRLAACLTVLLATVLIGCGKSAAGPSHVRVSAIELRPGDVPGSAGVAVTKPFGAAPGPAALISCPASPAPIASALSGRYAPSTFALAGAAVYSSDARTHNAFLSLLACVPTTLRRELAQGSGGNGRAGGEPAMRVHSLVDVAGDEAFAAEPSRSAVLAAKAGAALKLPRPLASFRAPSFYAFRLGGVVVELVVFSRRGARPSTGEGLLHLLYERTLAAPR